MDKFSGKKVLIIRTGAIGDVVQTTNIVRAIKKLHPDIVIDYVTDKSISPLLSHDKDISHVYEVTTKKALQLALMGFSFSKNKYDFVINLQSSLKFRIMSALCFPQKKVTYKKDDSLHAVENYINTAKKLFPTITEPDKLQLFLDPKLIKKFANALGRDRKIVVLNTQAASARDGRRWPIEYFVELASELIKKYDCRIIIPGTQSERSQVDVFRNLHSNVTVVAGMYNLGESAAIFANSDLFISGDTGPLHIASALTKPVCIGIFGSTPVSRCAPFGKKHYVLTSKLECAPCYKKKCKIKEKAFTPCLYEIKPKDVLELIEKEQLL